MLSLVLLWFCCPFFLALPSPNAAERRSCFSLASLLGRAFFFALSASSLAFFLAFCSALRSLGGRKSVVSSSCSSENRFLAPPEPPGGDWKR